PYHSDNCRCILSLSINCLPPLSSLFPYTTLFRSSWDRFIAAGRASQSCRVVGTVRARSRPARVQLDSAFRPETCATKVRAVPDRSEEHTSELQSRFDLVCRLLLEKKN